MRMLGHSPAFQRLSGLIVRYAKHDVGVLIEGETGTGKEAAARAIHYGSARGDRPFVPINCGAVPETLIESEIFGHRRGSFTDARSDQQGVIAVAEGGTLFLDEVDSLSAKAQVTLLRFLQDFEYCPVGSREPRRANVRVIAATNADLRALCQSRQFRLDLYYRLAILPLRVPPLRERGDDVVELAQHFLAGVPGIAPGRSFDAATRALLLEYAWPGNIRELQNVVYRAAVLTEGAHVKVERVDLGLTAAAIPDPPSEAPRQCSFHDARAHALDQFERDFIASLLQQTHGNVARAARLAAKERRAFGKLLKKHGIDRHEFL